MFAVSIALEITRTYRDVNHRSLPFYGMDAQFQNAFFVISIMLY